jgi:hypothetical protein
MMHCGSTRECHLERSHLGQNESGEPGVGPNLNEPKRRYLRHKVGVKSTRMVNTSSLPKSIAAEQTQV